MLIKESLNGLNIKIISIKIIVCVVRKSLSKEAWSYGGSF